MIGFTLLFLLAITLSWWIPGEIILRLLKLKLEPLSQMVLSNGIGFCLLGVQAYIFGYLHLRVLTYVYLLLWLAAAFYFQKFLLERLKANWHAFWRLERKVIAMLLIGVVLQSLQMVGTGLVLTQGMAFFRVHMQDGIYHLAMIQSMVRSFPPVEPGASGVLVQHYHYWSDLVFAELVRVFQIPANYLFFQFVPPVLSLLTGLAVFCLLRAWTKRKLVWFFGLVLLYFGADAGYLAAFLIHGQFSFQYPVIDNGATQFLNMPHVVAKLVYLLSLLPLTLWLKELKWRWGVLTIFLTAVLFGLKIYFGLLAVLGLGVIGVIALAGSIWYGARRSEKFSYNFRLVKQVLLLGVIGGIAALAIYLPPNKGAGGLHFYPLEWPKLMLAEGNLDWREWRYKLAVAELEGKKASILFYDLEAIAMTLLAIHGIRTLGIFFTKKAGKELGGMWIAYLVIPTLIFTFLGLYTLQDSGTGAFNVFNFFASSLTLMSLLLAFLFADLWEKRWVGKVIVIALILLSLPRIIFETNKIVVSYLSSTDVLYVSKPEMAALSSINLHYPTGCVVASSLSNSVDMNTPYVSYLANRETFMSGENVLETHDAPTKARFVEFKDAFQSNDGNKILGYLRSKGVCALYLKSNDPLFVSLGIHEKISYENKEAMVIDLRE